MDAASGEEQMVLKKRLLNYLERYFYLVAFGAYCRQEGGPQVMHFVIDLNFALFVRTRAVQKVLCCLAGREEGHRGHGGEGDQGLGRDHLLQPQHEHAGLILFLNFCLSNFSRNTSHPIPTETDTDPKPGYMGGCQGLRALLLLFWGEVAHGERGVVLVSTFPARRILPWSWSPRGAPCLWQLGGELVNLETSSGTATITMCYVVLLYCNCT